MDHLLHGLAPITDAGWQAVESEAKARLKTYLAARKMVDFRGPSGWSHSATNLGRVKNVEGPADGVAARQRRVLPLVELRSTFTVSRDELEDIDRGAEDADFEDLDRAARQIAIAENAAVFSGYPAAGIEGICQMSSHAVVRLGEEFSDYPVRVAQAVNRLLETGIGGPYGLAISPAGYTGIVETTELGDLLLDHLRQILGGPVVRAQGIEGGVVMSQRGGDFAFDCGQDLAIGYLGHSAEQVTLYLEESFSFRVLEPDAAVALRL